MAEPVQGAAGRGSRVSRRVDRLHPPQPRARLALNERKLLSLDADLRFEETYLAARQEDIVIIQSPVVLPGRAIRNAYLEDVDAGIKHPHKCSWKCLSSCPVKKAPYCIGDALMEAKAGELARGFPFAGANAWRVDEIVSVRELIDSLVAECRAALQLPVTVADCA